MIETLKKLNLKRDSKYKIGKRMGDNLWLHKTYVSEIITLDEYEKFKNELPVEFEFSIVRINKKLNEIAFIECNDFDKSNEPIVGSIYKVRKEQNEFKLSKKQLQNKDPLIYHHKWMFVKDNYSGFDVEESKRRSIEWKSHLGINKSISSRIGRLSFWDSWLKQEKLNKRK